VRIHLNVARSLFALLSLTTAFAQQPTLNYYRVNFIKTKPGTLAENETFMKSNVAPLAKADLKEGRIISWGYNRVVTPTGTTVNHDLIGMRGYEKWEQLEPVATPEYLKSALKALGFAAPADYNKKLATLRDVTRSEIWHRATGTAATPENKPKVGEYVVVSYLKTMPGKTAEYLDIWKKYSLPLQEDRIKAGHLKSYTMWTVGGSGSGSQYDVVSLSRFADFKDIPAGVGAGTAAGNDAADRIHAGKDWRQMRREMQALRTPVRSEIVQIRARESN